MEIFVEKNKKDSQICFYIEGRIDARTCHILHAHVRQYDFFTYSNVLFDFTNVEHVTSGVFGGPDPLNDNKPMINEQFVFTVVEKDNSQNQYNKNKC